MDINDCNDCGYCLGTLNKHHEGCPKLIISTPSVACDDCGSWNKSFHREGCPRIDHIVKDSIENHSPSKPIVIMGRTDGRIVISTTLEISFDNIENAKLAIKRWEKIVSDFIASSNSPP